MPSVTHALSPAQLASFVTDGFVRVDNAFSSKTAEEGRTILWRETGCDPDDKTTWTRPVIRLGGYSDRPFLEAANTSVLHAAYNQLAGVGNWLKPEGLGTFPVRFPSVEAPGDDGWHVDISFVLPDDDPADFWTYRANRASRGRALLMLFLFSDVGEHDAPTRIRVGSHRDIARFLSRFGEEGATTRQIVDDGLKLSAGRKLAFATGEAGTVYLCHPFLVHAAQPHRGMNPKFMAQPPLLPKKGFDLSKSFDEQAPVEQVISRALDE